MNELRVMIDAVTSSKSLTRQKTSQIVNKLKKMTSEHQAIKLSNQIYMDEKIKAKNNEVQTWIERLGGLTGSSGGKSPVLPYCYSLV